MCRCIIIIFIKIALNLLECVGVSVRVCVCCIYVFVSLVFVEGVFESLAMVQFESSQCHQNCDSAATTKGGNYRCALSINVQALLQMALKLTRIENSFKI